MASDKAGEVLRSIERLAERRYLPIIGPVRGEVLASLVRRVKPRRVLEVGTLLGYSTILMAKELGNEAEIVTIEIDEDEAELAKENARRAEVTPRVRVLVGDALDVIPNLEGEFDLIFLDAAKGKYFECLGLLEDKLKKGSLVVADNAGAYASSMREYLDYVRNSGKYESRFIGVDGDGVEVSVRL